MELEAKEVLDEIREKHNIGNAWQLTQHVILEAMEEYSRRSKRISKDDKLRNLTSFQHWLGSNYNNLPTDSGNMTKRAIEYLKEKDNE